MYQEKQLDTVLISLQLNILRTFIFIKKNKEKGNEKKSINNQSIKKQLKNL